MKAVVIGGGFGGVKAAIELAKRDIDVTLVSAKPYFLHHGLIYRAVTGHDVSQARFVARHIHSLHTRGHPAYRLPELKPLVSIPVSRFWAYSERHGVYVAGFVGSLIRRTAELNSYCHLLPFSQAYRLWRRGRSVVPACDLCADFREKM